MAASNSEIDTFLQAELARRGHTEVTAVEAASWLDEAGLRPDSPHRPGLPLRNLLRAGLIRSGEQRPPQKNGKWFIVRRSKAEASGESPRRTGPKATEPPAKSGAGRRLSSAASHATPEDPGHRVAMNWMGKEIQTLEDLLRPELRVLCIGINPAVTSVERGHYYQGQSGQRFLARLRAVGLLPEYDGRWEDDVAFELGIGQTDIVKRPTSKADKVGTAEFAYDKRELARRLKDVRAELVIVTFKEAAKKVFGNFKRHGFIPGLALCGGDVFVMPGPYERSEVTEASLSKLRCVASMTAGAAK